MDGTLPPLATPPPQQAPQQGFAPARQQQPYQPVGRPSGDPEQQEARAQRSLESKRIENILPRAVDSKCLVFKTKDGRTHGSRPSYSILAKDIEEAKNDHSQEPDDYIVERIREKFPDGGKFICKYVDKAGKPISQAWDVVIGEDGEEDLDDDDLDGDDGLPGFRDSFPAQGPVFAAPVAPPAPPAMDTQTFASAIRGERQDEARRGMEMTAILAQQQQASTQMMLQLQQQQREAETRARQDAADREEREARRRADTRTTLLTLVPLVLPLIERLFKRDAPAADPAASLMLEVVKAKLTEKPEKGFDLTMMGEVSKLMTTMAQGNLQAQQEQAQSAARMQGEVMGVTMKAALTTMKEIAEMKQGGGDKEESTMSQVMKVAAPLLAGLAQQQQPQAPNPAVPGNEPAQAAPVAAAAPAQPRPIRRPKIDPPAEPAPAVPATAAAATAAQPRRRQMDDPSKYDHTERVQMAVAAIRNLAIGKVKPEERQGLLTWVHRWAPPDMLAAVAAGDESKILEIGTTPIMKKAELLSWISEPRNAEFLMKALADLRTMMDGTMTREQLDNAVIDTALFQKQNGVQSQRVQPVAAEIIPNAPTPDEKAAKPVVAEAAGQPVPPAAGGADPAATATPTEAPAAAAEAPVKRRQIPKPGSKKAAPPAAT